MLYLDNTNTNEKDSTRTFNIGKLFIRCQNTKNVVIIYPIDNNHLSPNVCLSKKKFKTLIFQFQIFHYNFPNPSFPLLISHSDFPTSIFLL